MVSFLPLHDQRSDRLTVWIPSVILSSTNMRQCLLRTAPHSFRAPNAPPACYSLSPAWICPGRLHHVNSPRLVAQKNVCCKCIFQMFKMFQRYVSYGCCKDRSECCTCCNVLTRMLQEFVRNVLFVSDICCKCYN
jgi:hypothetical protein